MPWEKQFDQTEALDRALKAFWCGGYEGTSMTDLLEQMGIQKGSFYATFGSKHQILLDSLETYLRKHSACFEKLHEEPSPLAALKRHLRELFAEGGGEDGELGCFVVNMAIELSPKDEKVQTIVHRALAAHEMHYRKLLEAAKAGGEIADSLDPKQTARGLLALVLGMRVLARASMPKVLLESLRDQALALLGGAEKRNV